MLKLWPSFLSSSPCIRLTHSIGCNWQGEQNVALPPAFGHPNSLVSSIYGCNKGAVPKGPYHKKQGPVCEDTDIPT